MIDEPTHIYVASLLGIKRYKIIKLMPKTVSVHNPHCATTPAFKRTVNICFTLDEAIEEVINIHQRRRQRVKAMYDEEVLWDMNVDLWEEEVRKAL